MSSSLTTWGKNLPTISSYMGIILYLFAAGCMTDPDLQGQLGIPSSVVATLFSTLGTIYQRQNTVKASDQLPPNLTQPDGKLDAIEALALVGAHGIRTKNPALVAAIQAAMPHAK